MNDVTVYEGSKALVKASGMNYKLTSPMTGAVITLERDTDFGVIPKTKKPSLYKAGAEKIIAAYGLLQHYTIESKIEHFPDLNTDKDEPFFFYVVRCDLVRISSDGKEYVFTSGIGSANTKERRNGFAGAYDSANTTIRMAQKRAMVAAAVNISGASSAFTMDIEDSDFVEKGYSEITKTQDENAGLTTAQVKRLFAIANSAGVNASKAKDRLAIMGYTKATQVTQGVYDYVCEVIALGDKDFKERVKKNGTKSVE